MVDKSEKFRWLIRLGFAARGVVYGLLGYMLLTGSGQQAADGASGVFARVQDMPLGSALLYLCALGLLGYALYRLCSPLLDIEHYGSDKQGIAMRTGHAASGLTHLVLAWSAFQFARGSKQTGGDTAQEAAGTVLSLELGALVLGLVGAGFLLGALAQGKKAATARFMNRISSGAPGFVEWFGRAGYSARAVVFAIIGWSLLRSSWFGSSNHVKSLGEAASSLAGDGLAFSLVALGLLLFGIFSLFLARYRIVPDLGPQHKVPSFRAT